MAARARAAAVPGLGGAAPVFARGEIDRLGSEARDALGELGAHVTETIQGLAELIAFQAIGRRRAAFLAASRRYQTKRLALLDDLATQTAGLEIATGLGGLAVAVLGGRCFPPTAGSRQQCCRCWC